MEKDITKKNKPNWFAIIMTATISGIIAIITGITVHHFTKKDKAEFPPVVVTDNSSRTSITDSNKNKVPEKPPVKDPVIHQKKQAEESTPANEVKQEKLITENTLPDPLPPVPKPVVSFQRTLNAEDKAELDQLDPKTIRMVKFFHKTFDNESIQFAKQIKNYLFDKGIKGSGMLMGSGNFDAPGKRFIMKPTAFEGVVEIWVQVMN